MSRNTGIQMACDSCGDKIFLRTLFSPEHSVDTPSPKGYESPPEGWMNVPEFGDLCPVCARNFCVTVTRALNGNVPEKYKRY